MKKTIKTGLIIVLLILGATMVYSARLPFVGGDDNAWGTILNSYLNVSHTENGSLNKGLNASFYNFNVTNQLMYGGVELNLWIMTRFANISWTNLTYYNNRLNETINASIDLRVDATFVNNLFTDDLTTDDSNTSADVQAVSVGGEVSGTIGSIILGNDALDDQYYDSEADLTGLLDDDYVDVDEAGGSSNISCTGNNCHINMSCADFTGDAGLCDGNDATGMTNNTDINMTDIYVDNSIYIGNSDKDHYIYFYEDGSLTGEYLLWNDGNDEFSLSDNLVISDDIFGSNIIANSDLLTSGAGDDLWLGSLTQANAQFRAYANGDLHFNGSINGSVGWGNLTGVPSYALASSLPNVSMQDINDSFGNWSQYLATYPNVDTDSTDDLDIANLDNGSIVRSHNTSWIDSWYSGVGYYTDTNFTTKYATMGYYTKTNFTSDYATMGYYTSINLSNANSSNISISNGIITLNMTCEQITGDAGLCDGNDAGTAYTGGHNISTAGNVLSINKSFSDYYTKTETNETIDSKLTGDIWFFVINYTLYGTVTGNLSGTQQSNNFDNDGLNITEVAVNGLEYYANTSNNVTSDVNKICIRYKADGDDYDVYLYKTDGTWVKEMTLTSVSEFKNDCKDIIDSSNFIVDNKLGIKIAHLGSANTQHKLYLDAMYVSSGYTPRVGNEVDPISIHADGDKSLTNDWDAGGYTIHNVKINGTWNESVNYVPYTGANKNVDLGNNNLTINRSVGIGTTSPSAELEVKNLANDSWVQLWEKADTTNALCGIYETISSNVYFDCYDNAGNTDISFNTNGDSWIRGGDFAIGTNNPSHKFTVEDTTTTSMNVSNTLFVDGSNKKVGVGIPLPTHKLEVDGSMNVSGDLNISGIFTSDIAIGTSPFTIVSTTQVINLNSSYAGMCYDLQASSSVVADAEVDDDIKLNTTKTIGVADDIKIYLGTDGDVYIFYNSSGNYGELG